MSEQTRILVVDDDPALLAATVRILRSAGFDVLEATTGAECLEVARERRPDLVLLDVVLPDIDGRQVCRQLKADLALKHTFAVLVSGERKSADDRVAGLDVGADGCIRVRNLRHEQHQLVQLGIDPRSLLLERLDVHLDLAHRLAERRLLLLGRLGDLLAGELLLVSQLVEFGLELSPSCVIQPNVTPMPW